MAAEITQFSLNQKYGAKISKILSQKQSAELSTNIFFNAYPDILEELYSLFHFEPHPYHSLIKSYPLFDLDRVYSWEEFLELFNKCQDYFGRQAIISEIYYSLYSAFEYMLGSKHEIEMPVIQMYKFSWIFFKKLIVKMLRIMTSQPTEAELSPTYDMEDPDILDPDIFKSTNNRLFRFIAHMKLNFDMPYVRIVTDHLGITYIPHVDFLIKRAGEYLNTISKLSENTE